MRTGLELFGCLIWLHTIKEVITVIKQEYLFGEA